MFHHIEFAVDLTVDLQTSPKQPLERLRLRKGTPMRAQIRPHVVETEHGLIEMADLFFENGTSVRGVPFACFRFLD